MGVTDRVLFVRPRWPDKTISGMNPMFPFLMDYMYWIHDDIVSLAGSLGLDVVDLAEEHAVRGEMEIDLVNRDPALVIHGSHGGTNVITGQGGSELMCSPMEECLDPSSFCSIPNHTFLADRVMVTHSCKSATCLGPSAVAAGASAYIGSVPDLWMIIGDQPAYYNMEEVMKSCYSGSPTELLTGQDSQVAYWEELSRYNYWLDWYTEDGNPKPGYPYAEDLIDIINLNRSGWVHLGAPTVVTTKSRPASGRVRCTAWGGSPENPVELNIEVTIAGATHTTPFEIELGAGDYLLSYVGNSDTIRIWGGETTDLNLKLFTSGRLECTALYDSTEVAAEVVITDVGTFTTPFGIDLVAGNYHLVGQYESQVEERDFAINVGEITSIVLSFRRLVGPSAEIRNLAYPAEVVPGDPIPISFDLVNRGEMQGAMFAKLDSQELFRRDIPADGTQPVSGQIAEMPSYDLDITIEAGHSSELYEERVRARYDDTFVMRGFNFPSYPNADVGEDSHPGYRFTNVQIPREAIITSAELELVSFRYGGYVRSALYGEATGDAGDFGSDTPLVPDRPRTTAYVNWDDPISEPGIIVTSPDISLIIQEIVNRSDWTPGNAIVILHIGKTDGTTPDTYQACWTYDGDTRKAPKLKVEYVP